MLTDSDWRHVGKGMVFLNDLFANTVEHVVQCGKAGLEATRPELGLNIAGNSEAGQGRGPGMHAKGSPKLVKTIIFTMQSQHFRV